MLRAAAAPHQAAPAAGGVSTFVDRKVTLHRRLLETINLAALDKMGRDQAEREIGEAVGDLIIEERLPVNAQERTRLVSEVVDEVLGLGPIEPLLKDDTVTDILINTHELVFVERAGRLEVTEVRFKDTRHLLRILNKIVSAVGRRVDESNPMVDARLPDGSRVNAVIAPVAVDGPLVSIRKFAKRPYTMERLMGTGALTPPIGRLLEAIVRARRNVLISGGTGSGKTTLLNAMSAFIGQAERIVTIEDAAELQLQQIHVARMETRPASVEGKGEILQRDLVKNALRMRPDRIIVGEVRAGEAFRHASGDEHGPRRLDDHDPRQQPARRDEPAGADARHDRHGPADPQHARADRLGDQRGGPGRADERRPAPPIVSLQEITGMEGEVIMMQEIFRFARRSTDEKGDIHGHFEATGIRPKFMAELERRGIALPADLFHPNRVLE